MASTSSTTEETCPELEPRHKIFLSHSGAQKDFVEQLCVDLERVNHFPFFDKRPDSLPKGARFPELILNAARQCKLAVVVLSEEFVRSKWPLIELVTFIDEANKGSGGIQILPLFYKLSIEDCSKKENVDDWFKIWKELEANDSHSFDAQKCKDALQKVCSWNGEKFDKSAGEVAYRGRIVSSICSLIPPDNWVISGLVGGDRLCQTVVDGFGKAAPLYSSPGVPVLGLYGVGGIGKSTLCRIMCRHFSKEFSGKVWHMELPTEPTEDQVLKQLLLVLQNLSEASEEVLKKISTINQAQDQLKNRMQSRKVFLAIDNVWDNQISMDGTEAVLGAILAEGSKVFVTARTEAVLEKLLGERSTRVAAPSISEDEALNILLNDAVPGCKLPEVTEAERHIFEEVVKHWRCHPLAVKIIGGILSRLRRDTSRWAEEVKKLQEHDWGDDSRMSKLIERSYAKLSDKLKQVFLDVAVIMPVSLGRKEIIAVWARNWLDIVYESGKSMGLLEELRKYAFLDWVTPSDKIRIHDLLRDFAFQKVRKFDESRCIYLERRDDLASEVSVEDWGKVERIAVSGCGLESLERILKLERSSAVKSLCVRGCGELKELSVRGMVSLLSLEICECGSLSKLEGLSSLGSLRRSVVRGCGKLKELSVRGMVSLLSLEIRECGSLSKLEGLRSLGSLGRLEVWSCGKLKELSVRGMASLRSLEIQACECLSKLEGLSSLGSLRRLVVKWCRGLSADEEEWEEREIGCVELLCAPFRLVAAKFAPPPPDMMRFAESQELRASGCNLLAVIENLVKLQELRLVDLDLRWKKQQLSTEKMVELRRLECLDCGALEIVGSLSRSLEELHVSNLSSLYANLNLSHFPRLVWLRLKRCPNVRGVEGSSSTLRHLDIEECELLEAIPDLRNLKNLSSLQLEDCKNVSKLSVDARTLPTGLNRLHGLEMDFCPKLVDAWLGVCVDDHALDAPHLLTLAWVHVAATICIEVGGERVAAILEQIAAAPHSFFNNIAHCILKRREKNVKDEEEEKSLVNAIEAALMVMFCVMWRKQVEVDVVCVEQIVRLIGVKLLLTEALEIHSATLGFGVGVVAALAATNKYGDVFLTEEIAAALLDAYYDKEFKDCNWAPLPCALRYMVENKEIKKQLKRTNASVLLTRLVQTGRLVQEDPDDFDFGSVFGYVLGNHRIQKIFAMDVLEKLNASSDDDD